MSTRTRRPWAWRNSTESAIIASPSSSDVCNAWVTWYSELLATMHTAGVPASIRLRNVASSSTLPRGRRVDPKATSVLVVSCSSRPARAKNSTSFGFAPGQPPSTNCTPRRSSCSAMRSLSSTVAETPSTCRPSRSVVSNTSTCSLMMSLLSDQPRESKKPPTRAAPSCTWMVHVHYEMMMIAARRVASGEITAHIQSGVSGRRQPRTARGGAHLPGETGRGGGLMRRCP